MMETQDDEDLEAKKSQELGENDIIQKCIGSIGRWHIWVCFILFLVKFPVAFHQLNIVVLAPKIDFWCENREISECSSNCSKHSFDTSTFSHTITMQWDLVCDKKYLESIAQTLTMLGILTGSFIFGYLSDRYGRKPPLVWAVALQFLAGVSTAFVPWFYLFLLLRFFSSFATGGTMVTSFVLIMELIGVKWRTKVGIIYQIPFNIGHLFIPLISYFLRDWRHFQIAISVPSALLISYHWLLPESPRWLLAVGRTKSATDIMTKAAKSNSLPTNRIEYEIKEYMLQNHDVDSSKQRTGNLLDLFRTPVIRKYTLVLWVNWLFCGLSFFGSSQYIGQLGGNIFLNIALSAVIQIPGVIICCWTVEAWGRKTTLIFANILCGISLIVSGFVTEHPYWIKPVLASLGISCSMISFSTVYIYAGEIFPTIVRNIGLGSSSTFARIGSMIAPFIANLSSDKSWVPPSIFGFSMLVGAVLCYMLPETLNCTLPESIEDVERFEQKKSQANKKNSVPFSLENAL